MMMFPLKKEEKETLSRPRETKQKRKTKKQTIDKKVIFPGQHPPKGPFPLWYVFCRLNQEQGRNILDNASVQEVTP